MYSGIGGELLYQPYKKRWAIGGSVNYVQKRDFSRNFDLLNYRTSTAFLSLYYASPFYNYDFSLHIGRYLAKDKGITIDVRRSFDNGVSIGAFATFTNVSSREYGEGSFDKGLFIKIPFDLFIKSNTRQSFGTMVRSIQRDGGQMLEGFDGTIWHNLRSVRFDNLYNNKDRMIP